MVLRSTIASLSLWLVGAARAVADAVDTTRNSGSSYLSGARSESSSLAVGPSLTDGMLPSLVNVILVLIGVIAAIYLTLLFLKKIMGKRAASGGRNAVIEIIETCYLAPKQSISLVRIGARGALLGVTERGISPLVELSGDEIEEALAKREGKAEPFNLQLSFKDALGKAKRKVTDLGAYSSKLKRKDHSAVGA